MCISLAVVWVYAMNIFRNLLCTQENTELDDTET